MYCEENGFGLEFADGGNLLALATFAEGVAEKFGVVIEFFDFEHERIDRIAKFQELHVGLQRKAQIAASGSSDVGRFQRFVGGCVESFDVRPFQTNHIEGDGLLRARPLRIFSEPRFEVKAKITKSKGNRRTCDKVILAQRFEAAISEDGLQTRKIFAEAGHQPPPTMAIVNF